LGTTVLGRSWLWLNPELDAMTESQGHFLMTAEQSNPAAGFQPDSEYSGGTRVMA
jgi:hypothetical protein